MGNVASLSNIKATPSSRAQSDPVLTVYMAPATDSETEATALRARQEINLDAVNPSACCCTTDADILRSELTPSSQRQLLQCFSDAGHLFLNERAMSLHQGGLAEEDGLLGLSKFIHEHSATITRSLRDALQEAHLASSYNRRVVPLNTRSYAPPGSENSGPARAQAAQQFDPSASGRDLPGESSAATQPTALTQEHLDAVWRQSNLASLPRQMVVLKRANQKEFWAAHLFTCAQGSLVESEFVMLNQARSEGGRAALPLEANRRPQEVFAPLADARAGFLVRFGVVAEPGRVPLLE